MVLMLKSLIPRDGGGGVHCNHPRAAHSFSGRAVITEEASLREYPLNPSAPMNIIQGSNLNRFDLL